MKCLRIILLALLALGLLHAPANAAAAHHRHNTATSTTVGYGDWPGEVGTMYNPGVSTPYPTIIFVHGGGWSRGNASNTEASFAQRLSAITHWPVFSINYPVTDIGTTPVRQVERLAINDAVHYVYKLSTTDASHIIVWGESAGGHLGLLDGLREATYAHPRVSAVVSISGPADLSDMYTYSPYADRYLDYFMGESLAASLTAGDGRYDDNSPVDAVVPGAPAVFQAIGVSDPIAPPDADQRLDLALATAGGQHQLDLIASSDHASDLEPDTDQRTGDTVESSAVKWLFNHYATRS